MKEGKGKQVDMSGNTSSVPNQEFTRLATDEQINRTAAALEANNIHTLIAENGAEALRLFFELVPDGAEVFLGASVTLEKLGIRDEIEKSGRFDALRPRMFAMHRETQGREIRKLGGAPDYAAGSVHAVTEDGHVLIASKTGSQLGPYASGAGKVIWVVGAQKIVKDLVEGFRRIKEYCVPLEEVHMQELYDTDTDLNKILILNREMRPNRITMIIVKEVLGF
jgi:LUD domain